MRDAVRRAEPTDAAGLHHIAALTFPLACTPGTPDEDTSAFVAQHLSEQVFAGFLADPTHTVLVAVDDPTHELVGYSMVVAAEPADAEVAEAIRFRPTAELAKMYVHPERHGSGTAGRLMTAALDAARATGAAGVWLGVNEENARANAFYARHGFGRVGQKRFHVGARWEQDLVRERAL